MYRPQMAKRLPPPPYDPNHVANAMADQSAELRARLAAVKVEADKLMDYEMSAGLANQIDRVRWLLRSENPDSAKEGE